MGTPPNQGSGAHLSTVPTAYDKLAGDFQQITRLLTLMRENAEEIAKTRKALYSAYMKEGFTEAQALDLVRGSMVTL